MKLVSFPTICAAFAVGCILGIATAQEARVGSLSAEDFKKANTEGIQLVKALKPDKTPLSDKDKAFFQEIINGMNQQAAMSAMAPTKATSDSVKAIALAESEEQSKMAEKLNEIATAKGLSVAPALEPSAQKMVMAMGEKFGADFDKDYILNGAVKGHQTLQATMEKVRAQTKDATLRELAVTSLPLIQLHLRVSLQMAEAYKEVAITPPPVEAKPNPKPPVGARNGRFRN